MSRLVGSNSSNAVLKRNEIRFDQQPVRIGRGATSPKKFEHVITSPEVETEMVDGVVKFIKVTCQCGQVLTIQCDYSA